MVIFSRNIVEQVKDRLLAGIGLFEQLSCGMAIGTICYMKLFLADGFYSATTLRGAPTRGAPTKGYGLNDQQNVLISLESII